jgi:multidrug transporter EmrE-like cation transporter
VPPIVLIVTSVALGVVGQLMLKSAISRGTGQLVALVGPATAISRIATNPGIWAGLAVYGVGTFLWLVALSQVELGYAYPFISLSYVLILVASWALFGEGLSWWKVGGVAAICLGVCVVAAG